MRNLRLTSHPFLPTDLAKIRQSWDHAVSIHLSSQLYRETVRPIVRPDNVMMKAQGHTNYLSSAMHDSVFRVRPGAAAEFH